MRVTAAAAAAGAAASTAAAAAGVASTVSAAIAAAARRRRACAGAGGLRPLCSISFADVLAGKGALLANDRECRHRQEELQQQGRSGRRRKGLPQKRGPDPARTDVDTALGLRYAARWLRAVPSCPPTSALAALPPRGQRKERAAAWRRVVAGLMMARAEAVAPTPEAGAETAYALVLGASSGGAGSGGTAREATLHSIAEFLSECGLPSSIVGGAIDSSDAIGGFGHGSEPVAQALEKPETAEGPATATGGATASSVESGAHLVSTPTRRLAYFAGQFYHGAHGAKGVVRRIPPKALAVRMMTPEAFCMLWQELGRVETRAYRARGGVRAGEGSSGGGDGRRGARLQRVSRLSLDTSHLPLQAQRRLAQALGAVFRFEVTIRKDGVPITARRLRGDSGVGGDSDGAEGAAVVDDPDARYSLGIHPSQAARLARILIRHDPLQRLPVVEDSPRWMRSLATETHAADVHYGVAPGDVPLLKPELGDGLHDIFVGSLLGSATMRFRHHRFKKAFCIPVYRVRFDKPLAQREELTRLHATLEEYVPAERGPRQYGAGPDGQDEPRLTMRTRVAERFRYYYHNFFRVDARALTISKTAPADIADHLTPVAIAHWFADMGGVGDGASLVGEGHGSVAGDAASKADGTRQKILTLDVTAFDEADAERLRCALARRTGWCIELEAARANTGGITGEGARGGRRQRKQVLLLPPEAREQIARWMEEARIPGWQSKLLPHL